jgi:glycosyltransferase involved in cell wall biosynthesis
MTPAAVSVLIPTYNRASFLPETLASVFNQTMAPAEVILVDDGSTDDTQTVVRSLLLQHPGWATRLRFIRQENRGKSAALNSALAVAGGDWIAFNDSDDTWAATKLELQFKSFERFPRCLASFTETTLNEFNDRHPELTRQVEDSYGIVEHPSRLYPVEWPGTYMQTVVVRADIMRACGDIDTRYRLSQDVDFMFRLGLLTPFCYVNAPLVQINRDPARVDGLMTAYPSRSWTAMLESESMLQKWLTLVDESNPALRRIIKHELASARSALANRHILAGDLAGTRRTLGEAIANSWEARLLVKWTLAHLMPPVLRRFAARHSPPEFFPDQDGIGGPASPAVQGSQFRS